MRHKRLVTLLTILLLAFFVSATGAMAAIKSPGTWTGICNTPGTGLTCLPEAREGAGVTAVANRIFVTHGMAAMVGDTNDTRMYDISTDTWSDPFPSPAPAGVCSELATVSHAGRVYAVGGRGAACLPSGVCNAMEEYDPSTNAWSVMPSMPTARAGLAAVVFDDRLYAIGGRTGTTPGSGSPLNCLEAYDFLSGTWTPTCGTFGALTPMPVAAMDLSAIAHGGRIYVIGGASGPDTATAPLLQTVQIYDVASDSWTFGLPMPTARANLALGICGNVILALGGRTGPAFLGPAVNTSLVEAYEIPKDNWVFGLTPMPTAKSEHGAASHGGKVYVAGSGIYGNMTAAFEAIECSSLFQQP